MSQVLYVAESKISLFTMHVGCTTAVRKPLGNSTQLTGDKYKLKLNSD